MANKDSDTFPPADMPRAPSLFDPHSNPLYVHHADHAGISLVSEKLVGIRNFNSWRRSMIMALGARNKTVFVDGTFSELDSSHPDYGSWSHCNNIVCTWLVNSVDTKIAKSIMYLPTARRMWLDIHDQFKQSDGPRTADIKQQIFAETQGSQSVSDYYTKLKQLWEELKNHESPYTCCCSLSQCASLKRIIERDEQDHILKFLTGLNDTFTATRGQILMMEPRPNISKVFNLVCQEERQRSMKSTSAVAFNISQTNPDESVVAAYTGGYNKNRPRPVCSHCGLVGHVVTKCYKLHGYPQGYKNSNSNSRQQIQAPVPVTQNSTQQWPPRTTNVANMVLQDSGGISMHNQQGVHLGTVTQEQVHQLLSVLSTKHTPIADTPSQISGSTFSLSDGTASTSKPQPHLVTHTLSDRSHGAQRSNRPFLGVAQKQSTVLWLMLHVNSSG